MIPLRPAALLVPVGVLLLAAGACGGADESTPVIMTPLSRESPSGAAAVRATPAPETAVASPAVPTLERPRFVSLADLTTDVAVPELPAAFAPAAPDAALEALIEATLAGREGSYSVLVHNLKDGRYAAFNEGQVYYAASLYKMGVLLEAYKQHDAGELDFGQVLTLDEKYVAYDLGTLELLGLKEGDTLTLADAVKAMIVVSDTPSAVMVQDMVGARRVDATLRSLGIEDTSFADYDLPTTAKDMARLLEAVAAGEGVSPGSRREMLSLLLQEEIRGGVPAALPADAAVAHKTGNWTDATHDVALVWGPAGPYIIAVLTDRSWEWQPVVDVSGAVWEYFAANP